MKNAVKALGTIMLMAIIVAAIIACGPPKLKGTVTIDGEPLLGKTLTVNISSLGGSGIVSYQWVRGGSTVIGIDVATYTLQNADMNTSVSVTVTRSDNSGSVTSAPVNVYGYIVGDMGPGGGLIFYVNLDGFIMTDTGEKAHYLEAAPDFFPNLAWASTRFESTNILGLSTIIGSGRKNTALILAIDSNAPAALTSNNYSNNNKDDWFLPSRDELYELFSYCYRVGIKGGRYWSSSPDFSLVTLQDFYNGFRYSFGKGFLSNVCPIRAF